MANTYRLTLLYVRDDTGPAEHKRISRRIRRKRERAERRRVTREATMGFYSEQEEAAWVARLSDGDFLDDEFNNYLGATGHDDWEPEPYEAYDDTDYGDPYEFFDDDWDAGSMGYYRSRPEQPEDRIIKPEDAGKTLGEILQEAIERVRAN